MIRPLVTMKQVSKYRWELIGPNGLMLDDLYFGDKVKAENWVRAYISSWNNWDYKMEIL